ncbi:MAG: phytanoyl-CoA dioxygenase family protein [Acidimicrobiales bacterium]
MLKRLREDQVRGYHENGFSTAVPVLTADEVARFRAGLEAYEADVGHPLAFPQKSKPYLLFDWADEIVHHPNVLDAVEDIIGPNILIYHTTTWIKEPGQPAYVLWHQDATYFFLEPYEHITAWVALSDSTEESGCVRVLPRSHNLGQLPHIDAPDEFNMIKRGQGVEGYEDEEGELLPVMAGELSLHHTHLLHRSGGNNTNDRRIGVGVSYIPTHVRPIGRVKPSALLVRGVDEYGHFEPEARLKGHLTPEAIAAHDHANQLFRSLQDEGWSAASAS